MARHLGEMARTGNPVSAVYPVSAALGRSVRAGSAALGSVTRQRSAWLGRLDVDALGASIGSAGSTQQRVGVDLASTDDDRSRQRRAQALGRTTRTLGNPVSATYPVSALSTRKSNHHHPPPPFPVDAVAGPIVVKVIVAVDPLLHNNGFSSTQAQHGGGRRSCVVVMDEGDVRLEAVNGLDGAVICWFESRVACSGCGPCRNRYKLARAHSNGVDTTLAIRALCDGTE
ncbi:hypothetical protein PHJA_000757400 [Phtheirospermum japonicum]|uniref:Uncharacterized protein n=1 Tax=Phtheirospermum japonicum TaxID=374723 RepID=A0A830BGW4_9LAMI|nr:hypothetical protein PHJA_000757400 [Phtheirospermum japonicum]